MNRALLELTEDIEAFLIRVKADCDEFESRGPSVAEQAAFVDGQLRHVYPKLTEHFTRLGTIVRFAEPARVRGPAPIVL